MKKALGWVAAALLVGAPALANNGDEAQQRSQSERSKKQSETKATGGAGEQGTATEARELSGEVLRVDGNMVYLQHMGAVVPLQLQKSTQFEGVQGKKELKQGQQVRAQFTISGNQKMNLAEKVTVGEKEETGTGGAGVEGGGTGGAGFENEGYSRDPSGVMPDQNGTIIKNEGEGDTDIHNTPAGGRPESGPGVGGAGEEGQGDEQGDEKGGVFQTGDVSGKTRGTTVPEGEEPGTGSPMPRGETY